MNKKRDSYFDAGTNADRMSSVLSLLHIPCELICEPIFPRWDADSEIDVK